MKISMDNNWLLQLTRNSSYKCVHIARDKIITVWLVETFAASWQHYLSHSLCTILSGE